MANVEPVTYFAGEPFDLKIEGEVDDLLQRIEVLEHQVDLLFRRSHVSPPTVQ